MTERKFNQFRASSRSRDGAGVNLNRIFHREGVLDLDPFLLLDTFDSNNPSDYTKGFPLHPHRGIETFTYLIKGEIIHKDTLGNKGAISSGEYQWMRSGSGIMHEEMPQASSEMQGFQLWINMPKTEKMSHPDYLEGNEENIPVIDKNGYRVHLLSGEFDGKTKPTYTHVDTDIFDIELQPNTSIKLNTNPTHHVLVYMFRGNGTVAGKFMPPKSIVTLDKGDYLTIQSDSEPVRLFYFGGKPLNEPIAWGGPIVMNTQQELMTAEQELAEGTFIKHDIKL